MKLPMINGLQKREKQGVFTWTIDMSMSIKMATQSANMKIFCFLSDFLNFFQVVLYQRIKARNVTIVISNIEVYIGPSVIVSENGIPLFLHFKKNSPRTILPPCFFLIISIHQSGASQYGIIKMQKISRTSLILFKNVLWIQQRFLHSSLGKICIFSFTNL